MSCIDMLKLGILAFFISKALLVICITVINSN